MNGSWLYRLYLEEEPAMTLYVGRAKDPCLRLEQHRAGLAKQTNKCAARDGVVLAHLQMEVLARFSDDDWPTAEGDVTAYYQSKGQARWSYPYAFTATEAARGRTRGMATNAAIGWHHIKSAGTKALAKFCEEQKQLGWPHQKAAGAEGSKKALVVNRANNFRSQREAALVATKANVANDYTAQRQTIKLLHEKLHSQNWTAQRRILGQLLEEDRQNGWRQRSKAGKRGVETNRKNGWPNIVAANHKRWHLNRGTKSLACELCK